MALTAEQRKEYGDTYIQQAFKELLGREATPVEIAELTPSLGTDPNIHDTGAMRSRVAEFARMESERQRPDRERKDAEGKAKDYYGSVSQLFKNTLGREANDAEVKHFSTLLATGDADEYTINNFLQNLPEYTKKQDDTFRAEQRGEFEKADTDYYSEKLLPAIQQQMAARGRSMESSGYATALAQAAKQQAQERERYLTQLSSQQYTGRSGAARSDYETYMSRVFGAQDYSRDRSAGLNDSYTARQRELSNYDMQKSAYEDYLRRYGKRKGGLGGLLGGAAGAALGAYATGGSPQGASAGYGIGSGIGTGIEGQF